MRKKGVRERNAKEQVRKGTKAANLSLHASNPEAIEAYENTIICGDAARVLPAIPDRSIDIIITSPPYNFGHHYAGDLATDTREWNDYFAGLNAIWTESYRILKPGGRIAVNIQPLFSDYIPTHHMISRQLAELGFLWKAEVLWEKHNYNARYTAWGSWKSPSMPYLKYTWEYIEIFDKETHKKTGQREDIDITGPEFKEWVNARWSFPPETRMRDYRHPAMFPEELPRRLIKLFSYRGDVVLDPFNGAGTTTSVAYGLGRRFIGIDISDEYCSTAMKRHLKLRDGKKPRFVHWDKGVTGA